MLASQTLGMIAEYRGDRLHQLIPELIEEDASWVTQPTVYGYLHRRRQDLLTPFLGQTAFKGRFSTGRTRFVLPFTSGFQRWTPQQQQIFAGVLAQVVEDEQRDTPAISRVLQQLAALPDNPPTALSAFAGLDNPRQVVRDLALRMLGRLDAGRGIPLLAGGLR